LLWEPGLLSARIAPSDEERIAWLLRRLDGQEVRRARFVAALTCYIPKEGRFFFLSRGVCTGHIAHAPEGKDGFGYDPVFIPTVRKEFRHLGRRRESSNFPQSPGGIPHEGYAFYSDCARMTSCVQS
jgi:XTP/dITP diphosphohydrolase